MIMCLKLGRKITWSYQLRQKKDKTKFKSHWLQNSQQTRNDRELSKLDKELLQNPTANIVMIKDWRSGTRQGYPLPPFLFNIVLEILASAKKQEKEIRGHSNGKERNKAIAICRWHDSLY